MTEEQIDQLLWRESGMKGISAESGDMRQLLNSFSTGARLAVEVYVSAVAQAIASMATCIHGIDALVFTGGIGTNAADLRIRIVAELRWMGLSIDAELNSTPTPSISSADSSAAIHVLQVDEQSEIYRALSGMSGLLNRAAIHT